jgi:hypothetical protein
MPLAIPAAIITLGWFSPGRLENIFNLGFYVTALITGVLLSIPTWVDLCTCGASYS